MSTLVTPMSSKRVVVVEEGEKEDNASDAKEASPPPGPAGCGSRMQSAAPRSKVEQQCQEEMTEMAEQMRMTNHDMNKEASELSRAPADAENGNHAGEQMTSKGPLGYAPYEVDQWVA
ncbi:hypothetical protein Hanom_Chr06g00531701 [Helianthus anomalus]